jgi:hypothetical protein
VHWDGTSWRQIEPPLAAPRTGYVVATDPARSVVQLGGLGGAELRLAQWTGTQWRLDPASGLPSGAGPQATLAVVTATEGWLGFAHYQRPCPDPLLAPTPP